MKAVNKAVEVLKSKYGIDARIYDNKVYLAVWNDDLSDTIDVEASSKQVLEWASEYIKDDKVNGYTNIQTYRLCVWLDNSVNYHNKGLFDYFFDLVRDGEFEESDYEVIDWNEVVERYSNEQRSHYLGSITRS